MYLELHSEDHYKDKIPEGSKYIMGGGHMYELGSPTGCGLRSSYTPPLAKTEKKGPSINVVS